VKSAKARLILLIVILIGGAGGYWVYENLEWKEVRIPGTMQGEAARNDLLVAERLVNAMGGTARSEYAYTQPPAGDPRQTVLVLPTERRILTARQRGQLIKWIEDGGHLVAVTYSLEDDDTVRDELLGKIGIRQYLNKPVTRRPGQQTPQDDDAQAGDGQGQPRPRSRRSVVPRAYAGCPAQRESGALAPRFGSGPGTTKTMHVCFDPRFRIETKGEKLWESGDAAGSHAITVAHGAGRITVLTDYDFMRNSAIGYADHADFLLAVIGFRPDLTVRFIPREDVAGIVSLAWRYGWPVLILLGVWTVLALWRVGSRLGPIEPEPEAVRRSLEEHVRAIGEYLWRRGEALVLWKSALAGARKRMELTLPPTPKADDRLILLSKKTGLDLGLLQRAFYPRPSPSAEEFARAISTLETVRKHL
jgi:hypothetical protein